MFGRDPKRKQGGRSPPRSGGYGNAVAAFFSPLSTHPRQPSSIIHGGQGGQAYRYRRTPDAQGQTGTNFGGFSGQARTPVSGKRKTAVYRLSGAELTKQSVQQKLSSYSTTNPNVSFTFFFSPDRDRQSILHVNTTQQQRQMSLRSLQNLLGPGVTVSRIQGDTHSTLGSPTQKITIPAAKTPQILFPKPSTLLRFRIPHKQQISRQTLRTTLSGIEGVEKIRIQQVKSSPAVLQQSSHWNVQITLHPQHSVRSTRHTIGQRFPNLEWNDVQIDTPSTIRDDTPGRPYDDNRKPSAQQSHRR